MEWYVNHFETIIIVGVIIASALALIGIILGVRDIKRMKANKNVRREASPGDES